MHFAVAATALFSSLATAQSVRGFNTGSTELDGSFKTQQSFENEFNNQKNIRGTNGAFTNARLYTMIQGGTSTDPISAIPAAIATDTRILLGLWASAGQESFNNELAALQNAIEQYGEDFTSRVIGISVGSEDLYRITPTGIENEAGIGAGPDVIVSYIQQLREILQDSPLSGVGVGHVDTWTAWVNGTNKPVVDNADWIGLNSFPYYQSENANSIENGGSLFFQSYDATVAAVAGKPIWVTESGWPVSGPEVGDAVASVENARSYWVQVYCALPASTPVFWYTQRDANAANAASFGITGDQLITDPLYNLNCPPRSSSTSSTVSSTTRSVESTSTFSTSETTESSPATTTDTSSPQSSGTPESNADQTTVTEPSATSTPDSTTETTAPTTTPTNLAEDDGNAATHVTSTRVLALLAIPALLALMA